MWDVQVAVAVFLFVGPRYSQGLRQVFHDDFTHLDPSQWTNEISASGFGNGEFQIYSPENRNCFVKDGVLHLKPTLTADRFGEDFLHHGVLDVKKLYGSCTNGNNNGCYHDARKNGIIPPTMSCKLRSKAAIRYGRVEIWAQMPEGDWLWPAIWMMPRDSVYGGWPRSGEIDIAELRGNLHYSGGTPSKVSSTVHFGVDWNHGHRSVGHSQVAVDDVTVLNATTPSDGFFNHYFSGDNIYKSGGKNAPFDREFYIILNVAVGGTKGWFYDGAKNYPHPKPWVNSEGQSTSMEKFWKDKAHWYPTWHGDTAAMKIRSVTMWTY